MHDVSIGCRDAAQKPVGIWEYSDPVFSMSMTFEEWLACEVCAIGWSNRQTRMLGAKLDGTGRAGLLAPVTEAVFRRAAHAVDTAAWVGIVERFAESWPLLVALVRPMFNLSPELPAHRNRAQSSWSPSTAQLARLAELNQFDMRLYELGVSVSCG